MTIPNVFEEIHEQGIEQGIERMAVALLRERFPQAGERDLEDVARRLVGTGTTQEIVHRIGTASALDDL